jgi:hypothetical protein
MTQKSGVVIFFAILTLSIPLGIFMVWSGFHEVSQVFLDVKNSADHTSFQNRIGLTFSGVLLPMLYLLCILEFCIRPLGLRIRGSLANRIVIILLVIFVGGGILFSTGLQDYVSRSGYQYCSGASSIGVFKTLVYTIDGQVCTRLAEERKMR